jgi:hypothetical protein
MSYVPLVSPLAPTCQDMTDRPTSDTAFDSKISFEITTPGMKLKTVLPPMTKPPPGLKFFAKAKVNAAAGQAGGPGAEPEAFPGPMGFLKRYWYIIVPLLLMNLFAPQPPAEEKPAVNGESGQIDASPPAAQRVPVIAGTGANTASPGSVTPKRRGKRG